MKSSKTQEYPPSDSFSVDVLRDCHIFLALCIHSNIAFGDGRKWLSTSRDLHKHSICVLFKSTRLSKYNSSKFVSFVIFSTTESSSSPCPFHSSLVKRFIGVSVAAISLKIPDALPGDGKLIFRVFSIFNWPKYLEIWSGPFHRPSSCTTPKSNSFSESSSASA